MKVTPAFLTTTAGLAIHFTSTVAIGIDELTDRVRNSIFLRSSSVISNPRGLESSSDTSTAETSSGIESCDEPRDLDQFPQWQEEVGYWIGDYSFYGADGTPNVSPSWNYPYGNYKGFITGNISGGSYRQRNVFLYPPQTAAACAASDSVVGNGTCGTNGNSKLFDADQTGSSCDGSISGPYAGIFDTKTTLVGNDNVILYQVYFQGILFQSQMTTLTGNGRRTRSAHNFDAFAAAAGGSAESIPTQSSFYRERRVEKEEFYASLGATLSEYRILEEDTCTRDNQGNLVAGGGMGGMAACEAHLEESFDSFGGMSTESLSAPLPTATPSLNGGDTASTLATMTPAATSHASNSSGGAVDVSVSPTSSPTDNIVTSAAVAMQTSSNIVIVAISAILVSISVHVVVAGGLW